MPKTNINRDILIDMVRNRPFLYDKRNRDFRNINKKASTWEEIGAVMQCTGKEARTRWVSLRDKFTRELRSFRDQPSGSAGGGASKWYLFPALSFLKEFTRQNDSFSNFDQSSSSSNRSAKDDECNDDDYYDESAKDEIGGESNGVAVNTPQISIKIEEELEMEMFAHSLSPICEYTQTAQISTPSSEQQIEKRICSSEDTNKGIRLNKSINEADKKLNTMELMWQETSMCNGTSNEMDWIVVQSLLASLKEVKDKRKKLEFLKKIKLLTLEIDDAVIEELTGPSFSAPM